MENLSGSPLRALKRALGLPDGRVHVGKGRLPDLAKALAADVERRLREFSDDDPTGEPCGGCLMMALTATVEAVADVASKSEFRRVSGRDRAAFLEAIAQTLVEAADLNLEGKSFADSVEQRH